MVLRDYLLTLGFSWKDKSNDPVFNAFIFISEQKRHHTHNSFVKPFLCENVENVPMERKDILRMVSCIFMLGLRILLINDGLAVYSVSFYFFYQSFHNLLTKNRCMHYLQKVIGTLKLWLSQSYAKNMYVKAFKIKVGSLPKILMSCKNKCLARLFYEKSVIWGFLRY